MCAVVVVVVVADGEWLSRASDPASRTIGEYFSSRVPSDRVQVVLCRRDWLLWHEPGGVPSSCAELRRAVVPSKTREIPALPKQSTRVAVGLTVLRGDLKCAPGLHRRWGVPGQRSVVDVSVPHGVDGVVVLLVLLLVEGHRWSSGRVREARPGTSCRCEREGEEKRSGAEKGHGYGVVRCQRLARMRILALQQAEPGNEGGCRALVVVVDRTGMVHSNLELRERGGGHAASQQAHSGAGHLESVKPASRQAGGHRLPCLCLYQ